MWHINVINITHNVHSTSSPRNINMKSQIHYLNTHLHIKSCCDKDGCKATSWEVSLQGQQSRQLCGRLNSRVTNACCEERFGLHCAANFSIVIQLAFFWATWRFCEADELKEWDWKSWTKRRQSQFKLNVQTGRRASLVEGQSCTEFGSGCWFLRGN